MWPPAVPMPRPAPPSMLRGKCPVCGDPRVEIVVDSPLDESVGVACPSCIFAAAGVHEIPWPREMSRAELATYREPPRQPVILPPPRRREPCTRDEDGPVIDSRVLIALSLACLVLSAVLSTCGAADPPRPSSHVAAPASPQGATSTSAR